MRIFTENVETPANGGALTVANTGFTSFSGAQITASTAHSVGGAKSAFISTASQTSSMNLDVGTVLSLAYVMFYLYLPSIPSSSFYVCSTNLAGAARANMRINADGTVTIRNGSIAVYTSSVALAAAQWSRIEWRIDATNSAQQLRLYTGSNFNSTTATSDSGNQTFNLGTFDTFLFGVAAAPSSTVSLYMDYMAVDNATWVGPGVTTLTANAGANQSVSNGSTVTLHGSASGGSGTYTYSWTQTAGPTTVTLTGATTATPTFNTTVNGTYTFQLTVNDGVSTNSSSTNVTVAANQSPTVSAGAAQGSIEPWSTVTLHGTASDSDGTISSVLWAQTSGTPVTLTGANTLTPTYTSPGTIAGDTATFRITATDNNGAQSTANTTVTTLPATERAVIGGVEVPARFRTN